MAQIKYSLDNFKNLLFIFTILFTLLMSIPVSAQIDSTNFDTKGTDFWLAFPPNYHNGKQNPLDYYDDSLYIFITSDKPTTGKIEYCNLSGRTFTQNFSIPDPKKIYSFDIFYNNFELLGYNDNSGTLNHRNNSEVVTKQYFHITSDNEVTVYMHDQANTTSDACLVFPTDILGKDYFVLTYNSDGITRGFGGQESWTPSQFVVLATEDSTHVEIIPKDNTEFNGKITQNIILNQGEAYLVQAQITYTAYNKDMTGSEVHSDKPVAVFASHQRSTIPVNNSISISPSRDYLLEEMPPIETWGENAFLIPYVQPPGVTNSPSDLFRIIAANNNTDIYINNVLTAQLNRGEIYEGNLLNAAHVESNSAILVAQYKKTSSFDGGLEDGDPFEMLIPPVEQFMTSYRIINTQARQYSNSQIVYTEQYIIIVAPDTSLSSTLLDGMPVQPSSFRQIPTTNYVYANIRVSDGVHTISSFGKMGVYVYGYGTANSYGYVGGMSMKPIDFSPPQLASYDSCYSVRGFIYDSLPGDSHIKSIVSPPESQVNVNVNIEPFTPYPKIVGFSAMLLDFYKDGDFNLVATDSAGLYSTNPIAIPGFTISVKGFNDASLLPLISKLSKVGKAYCIPMVIENYGKHPQTINNLFMNDTGIVSINFHVPKTLQPTETDTAWVCFSSPRDTMFIDTISVVEDCGTRKIQALDLTFKSDVNKPQMQMASDPCNKDITVSFSDSTVIDLGLEKVDILDTINCSVSIESNLPAYENLKISVIDPYKDAIYHLMATDSAGLTTEITDTIQGFTIAFPELASNSQKLDFGDVVIGNLVCDSLKVMNTGILPITFDSNIKLGENIIFSLPASQIPVTLKPGETKSIIICFNPLTADTSTINDTLKFEFNCMEMKIAVTGAGLPKIQDADSKCNIPVRFTINELPSNMFLNQNEPNPAAGTSVIKFGLNKENNTSLKVYDIFGNTRSVLVSGIMKAGNYEIDFDTKDLPQGIYIYVLSSDGKRLSRLMSISR